MVNHGTLNSQLTISQHFLMDIVKDLKDENNGLIEGLKMRFKPWNSFGSACINPDMLYCEKQIEDDLRRRKWDAINVNTRPLFILLPLSV